MLIFITWLWGNKYDVAYVEKLYRGIKRHCNKPFRFFCMTERERNVSFPQGIERHAIKNPELLSERGCFVRLRIFDSGWQRNRGIHPDDLIVNIDLDNVIVGNLDGLFENGRDFSILQGINSNNPCPYNGSLMELKPYTLGYIWTEFSLEKAYRLPYFDFPDDQGWLWEKYKHAGKFGPENGVYAYGKPGWVTSNVSALPYNARIVAFPGWRDPAKFTHLPWIKEHWQ